MHGGKWLFRHQRRRTGIKGRAGALSGHLCRWGVQPPLSIPYRVPTINNESLVNLPNWLHLTFRIDGDDWFDIDDVTVLSYRQTLDLHGAVLTREMRFCDGAGRTSSVTQRRFVAMHMPHVAALTTTIVAEDWSGRIEIRSTLDGNVRNSLGRAVPGVGQQASGAAG